MTTSEMQNLTDLQMLLDTIPSAVLVIDNGVHVFCNLPAVHMFHAKDRKEIIGKTYQNLSSDKQQDGRSSEDLIQILIPRVLSGQKEQLEWIYSTLDGTLFTAEVILSPITFAGSSCLMVCITPLDEKRQAEEKIRIAITQISSNIDNLNEEIQDPLSIITNLTEDMNNITGEQIKKQIIKIKDIITQFNLGWRQSEHDRVFLLNHYVTPIKQFSEIANKVSMGDLQTDIDVFADSEIDGLTESFRRMINAFKMMEAIGGELKDEKEQSEKVRAFLMNHYVTPIQRFTEIINKVSMGDLQIESDLRPEFDAQTNDVIDALTESFRRMINAFKMMEAMNSDNKGERPE